MCLILVSERSPGVGNGNPNQLFLPGEFYGQRGIAGYSPWDSKESDMTGYIHKMMSISLTPKIQRWLKGIMETAQYKLIQMRKWRPSDLTSHINLTVEPNLLICQFQCCVPANPSNLTRLLFIAQLFLALRPYGLQHARLPCPSPSPRVCSLMSIELVMPSNHLILCRSLLFLPSIFPSIRVFSNESALRIRWPKYWNFSFSITPSSEYSGLISFRIDWLELFAAQETLKSLLKHHIFKASIIQCSAFFIVQLSHLDTTTGKIITLPI